MNSGIRSEPVSGDPAHRKYHGRLRSQHGSDNHFRNLSDVDRPEADDSHRCAAAKEV